MFAQIKHMAIVSSNVAQEGDFYQAIFGMKSKGSRPGGAIVVRDGYVGLNINPRAPGRQAGFDHFGFEVKDVELVYERMRKGYASIEVLKRPSNRPFAGISTHDPAGNVFDLSQEGMENRTDVYVEEEREQPRRVKHFALRVVDPKTVGKFYRDVFELTELEKPAGDPNYYLSDGKVTLMIYPWRITDFAGTGIERPAPDHIGFKVENIEAVKKELAAWTEKNVGPTPTPANKNPEREARRQLFSKCPYGKFQLSDPDGVLIDVSDS